MKYMADFISHFEKRAIFSMRDARIFMKARGASVGYLHFLIHYLLKKGKLKRLAKGSYTFREDVMAAGFAFSPFYYCLHQALSLKNALSQAANPVIITTRKIRPGVRGIMGTNVVVRRISPKMFFGFEMKEHYGLFIPVSDTEKTFIDFIYFRQKIHADTMQFFIKRIDRKKLDKYLKKTPKWARKRVLHLLAQGKISR